MQSAIGESKKTILPPDQQVHITLNTQDEIDQLFAVLNFTLISTAIKLEDSCWENLRRILKKSDDYFKWHSLLSDHF